MLKIKTKHLGLDDFILLSDEKDEEVLEEEYFDDEYLDPDEEKIMKLSKHIRHNTKNKYLIKPRLEGPEKEKLLLLN